MMMRLIEINSDDGGRNWNQRVRLALFWFVALSLFMVLNNLAPRMHTGQLEGTTAGLDLVKCSYRSTHPACWQLKINESSGKRLALDLPPRITVPAIGSLRSGDPVRFTYVYDLMGLFEGRRWPVEIRSGNRIIYDRATSQRERADMLSLLNKVNGLFMLLVPLATLLWSGNARQFR